MIGVMLQHAGWDPTVFVGGEVPELGGNVRVGSPDGPFVAEACEAYDSFLYLKPDIAVITNIEADHLDHYGTEERVFEAFHKFLSNVPKENGCMSCICSDEDGNVDTIVGQAQRKGMRYLIFRLSYARVVGSSVLWRPIFSVGCNRRKFCFV